MRIVIFTDVNSISPTRLIRATLRHAGKQTDCRIVGFVTTRPTDFRIGLPLRTRVLLQRAALAVMNPEVPCRSALEFEIDLFRTGRRCGIPVLVPPGDDPNDPAFLEELVSDLRPDVALSFYCRHRLGRRLRSAFAHAVNYHDGLLPDYRGVMATPFSIYAGEASSGFTFHRMTGKFDAGPVLLQDALPIDESSNLDEVVRRKSLRAAAAVPRVLDLVFAGDPGRPQSGEGSYFSAHDWMAMTHLSRPENATRREVLRRIRAFGTVHLTIGGETYPVTRVRSCRPGAKLSFRTGDDHLLAPDRFMGLPSVLYRHRPGERPGP